jgi:hypothetical protein
MTAYSIIACVIDVFVIIINIVLVIYIIRNKRSRGA